MAFLKQNKPEKYYIYSYFGWYNENPSWVSDYFGGVNKLEKSRAEEILKKIISKIKNNDIELFTDSEGKTRIINWNTCQEVYMEKR